MTRPSGGPLYPEKPPREPQLPPALPGSSPPKPSSGTAFALVGLVIIGAMLGLWFIFKGGAP